MCVCVCVCVCLRGLNKETKVLSVVVDSNQDFIVTLQVRFPTS